MKKQEKKLKKRITITVDRDVYEALRFNVGNASAYANKSIKRQIAIDELVQKAENLKLINLEI